MKRLLVSVSLLLVLFSGSTARAATLYLEPSQSNHSVGNTFIKEIRINLEPGENINVVEVHLKYPNKILEVKDVSLGNSLITIIPQKPVINQEEGIISFAGGIPGGYTGRVAGDPGLSNLLGRIVFRAHETDAKLGRKTEAKLEFLEGTQVLLNDGFGTPTNITLKTALINISELGAPTDEWQKELKEDKIPPESFGPEIRKDPTIFDGKHFLIFSTTDKQTGLDYYEISETKNKDEGNWQRGESPYLLTDQNLKSFIKVKAIDKAGNERIEIIYPQVTKKWIIIPLISILIIIFILYLWLKKFLRTKKS